MNKNKFSIDLGIRFSIERKNKTAFGLFLEIVNVLKNNIKKIKQKCMYSL